MRVSIVPPEKVYPLRQKILRPGLPLDACQYPGDPEAVHFAGFCDDRVVTILSIYPEDVEGVKSDTMWRIRGVATEKEFRGRGFASRLLASAEAHVAEHSGDVIWCNARVNASGFYRSHRYEVIGDKFVINGIGEHYRMVKTLSPG